MSEVRDDIDALVERARQLVEDGDFRALSSFLAGRSPDEVAELIDKLDDPSCAAALLKAMDVADAADTLMSIYPELRSKVVMQMPLELLAKFVEELPSDDAVDLLGELDEELVDDVLALVSDEKADEVRELFAHPDETAGALMAHEVEKLPASYTVAQAIADLVRFGKDIEEIFQIFIVDEDGRLLGTVPIQRLLVSSPVARMADIADPVEVVVPVDADREWVADQFRRRDIVSAPVVDEEGRLLGRITIDDVLDVVDEEASEDLYKMVGIELEEEDVGVHNIKHRIPWLLVAFGGELVSGMVLKHFSATIRQVVLLASFIPLIMALGGNVGMQSAAVMIRRIALSRWGHSHHGRAVAKEIIAGMLLGIITGAFLLAIGAAWGEVKVGIVAAVAIVVAMTVSATVGSSLPVVLSKLGADPAFATGPFITTFNDVCGLLIYMVIATLLLRVL